MFDCQIVKCKDMNRITMQEFMSLPNQEKFEILEKKGKFLKRKNENRSKTEVYALESFFVEVTSRA